MVVTRSQGDREEERREEERRNEERLRAAERGTSRRVFNDPPRSPSEPPRPAHHATPTVAAATAAAAMPAPEPVPVAPAPTANTPAAIATDPAAPRSVPSVIASKRSHRSTASTRARILALELQAQERIVEIRRKEMALEMELVKKRLAAEVMAVQAEEEELAASEKADSQIASDPGERVEQWLQDSALQEKGTATSAYPRQEETTREPATSSDRREPVATRGEGTPSFRRPGTPPPRPLRGEPPATLRTPRVHVAWDMEEPRGRLRSTSPRPRRSPSPRPARPPRASSPSRSRDRNGIEQLAEALRDMARSRPPPRQSYDLPAFTGIVSEWLPFKAAYCDSTELYNLSSNENLARLRNSLKGEARDAVAALLFTATDPRIIMRTLEQCFGRPEVIIDRALEDIKRLPRPGSAAGELNAFAVKLQNVVCVLKNIDRRGYLFNPMLAREVLEKLSPHLRSRWCDYADEQEGTTDPEIVVLSRFLTREADRALRHTYAPTATAATVTAASAAARKGTKPKETPFARKRQNVYTASADVVPEPLCPNCEQSHPLLKCPKYKAMSVEQRWELVKAKMMCFKCIDKKHRRAVCKARSCGIGSCTRPHHATLHMLDRPAITQSAHENEESTQKAASGSVMSVAATTGNGSRAVLLKVCPVIVAGPRGEVNTYALLDEGATISLIDEDLAHNIGAEGPARPLHIHGVNTMQREQDSRHVTVRLRGKDRDSDTFDLQARTIKELRLMNQTIPTDVLKHHHLRDLESHLVTYEMARPLILIGADHWHLIVSRELRTGHEDEPAASNTKLGWVIHGSMPSRTITEKGSVLHVFTNRQERVTDGALQDLVEQHFRIDSLGVTLRPRVSEADRRAIEQFEKTARRVNKRFEVGLQWAHDDVQMPPSYDMAFNRLRSIERKMDKSPEFAREYTAQIDNLLAKGYATKCERDRTRSAREWFLPHFAVTNPNKPGKLRLVFDAAAQSHGVSLNDKLLDGPDLLRDLLGILFRFRENEIAVTADIREMFLQVKIREEDQPSQLFLWRGNDRENPPVVCRMTSMIFGARSSPFLAHSVRNRNALDHAETHPRALHAITNSTYMDDQVDSYVSCDEAKQTIKEVIEVHAQASFELRGWQSNDPRVLADVPDELRAPPGNVELGKNDSASKILGLYWDVTTDQLAFNTAMNRVPTDVRTARRAPTKREALSAVMSIFDPLGLLSQYTIRAKIILQKLWRIELPWDEPIPHEEAEDFNAWLNTLTSVAQLRLPRIYSNSIEKVELHVMCDASEQAFATCAYWRVERKDGSIGVILVAAKAKVAPKRAQSMPRLELQAALIGTRLAETVRREHRLSIERTIYWTDSTTVIQWIRNDARRYTPFVAHRLGEISESTAPSQWRWLPTNENVADDATRMQDTPICSRDRWFTGPGFLYKPEEEWPEQRKLNEPDEQETVAHAVPHNDHEGLPEVVRFSNYDRLIGATARVLFFIDRCRRRTNRIGPEHYERAECLLIKSEQNRTFAEDIQRIRDGKVLRRTSRLFKLDPALDSEGMLRLRGRVDTAMVPFDTKRPVVLDGRSALTKLLVLKQHRAAGHANNERVVNELRQRYWILRVRPTVRHVAFTCPLCKVRKVTPTTPVMGDLPKARVDAYQRAFSNTALDYFGPVSVVMGRRREKRWGALFTCLTTRAIHLELVSSLSTDSAIMAIRRMAARRGWPRTMYSDNATCFRGADVELRTAYKEWAPAFEEYATRNRMRWIFIPPGAPNQGGAWERLVRSVKVALGTVLKERALKEEVLLTLMQEAEHTINARPLTHVSVDPRDPEALTPNHFLLGSSSGLPTTGPCDPAGRSQWKAAQALADHFWQRWLHEYLPTLVPRGEATDAQQRKLQEGDVVIVVDNTLPRNTWPYGIVEKTYPGPDGGVRSADVRTKGGVFRRPTTKLAVLVKEEDKGSE